MTPAPRGGASRKGSALLAVIATLGALVAGGWLGIGLFRSALTTPSIGAGTVLESGTLHRLGLGALILDISNSDFLADLNRGPLQITEDHVRRVLNATYDSAQTTAKAAEVHAAVLHFIRTHPEGDIFRVSIEEERPVLADSMGAILLQQYAALPDCDVGSDVGSLVSAAQVRFFGASGEEFFSEEHPDCRPPDVVAEPVAEGLRTQIEEMATSGPDSMETFPDDPDDPEFAALMGRVNRGLRWSHPAWPLLLFGAVLAGSLVKGPRTIRWLPLAGFGVGLAAFGLLAVGVAPDRIQETFQGLGTPGEASEIWGQLGSYALQRASMLSGSWAVIAGLVFIAAYVLVWWSGRRGRARVGEGSRV